jgi:hypothetical protein
MATRCSVLEAAGYRAACVLDLASALKQAAELQPELIILGHSFDEQEQTEFIEQLEKVQSNVSVMCLRLGILRPPDLLRECESLLALPAQSVRIRIVDGSELSSAEELGSPLPQAVPEEA